MFSASYSKKIWKTALLPIVDFISILFGAGLIYIIRYWWLKESVFGFALGAKQIYGNEYLNGAILFSFTIVLVYSFLGLYEVNRRESFWRNFINLAIGVLGVMLALITYFFFYEYDRETLPGGVPVSRFILGAGGFLILYSVLLGRGVIWAIENLLYRFGLGKVGIVIIADKTNYLLKQLHNRRQDINKIYSYTELTAENYAELEQAIKNGEVGEIYLYSSLNEFEPKLALLSERYKISFVFSPQGLKDYQAYDLRAVNIGQKVFLELRHTKLDGWQIVLKRVFDLIFSLSFIVLFSWLYILIAILIKLDSRGPIFYGNKRVGPNGKEFVLWKFRRLKKEYCTTDDNQTALQFEQELIAKNDIRGGVLYKIKDDPRATKMGKFLEKTSLDELPQFFNVLIGNLSVVGPRPHQLREVAKYATHHFKVLNIKPGITGLAQINGRSDLDFEDEVTFDTYYVENWNFFLDLWIIIKTPIILLFKRHRG